MKNLFGKLIKRVRKTPIIPKNSKPYFPSNGTDGFIFESNNCNKCSKLGHCTILLNAYCGDRKPKQWITLDNKNICISLKLR